MKGRRGQRELLLRGLRGGAAEVTPGGGEGRGGALGGRNVGGTPHHTRSMVWSSPRGRYTLRGLTVNRLKRTFIELQGGQAESVIPVHIAHNDVQVLPGRVKPSLPPPRSPPPTRAPRCTPPPGRPGRPAEPHLVHVATLLPPIMHPLPYLCTQVHPSRKARQARRATLSTLPPSRRISRGKLRV